MTGKPSRWDSDRVQSGTRGGPRRDSATHAERRPDLRDRGLPSSGFPSSGFPDYGLPGSVHPNRGGRPGGDHPGDGHPVAGDCPSPDGHRRGWLRHHGDLQDEVRGAGSVQLPSPAGHPAGHATNRHPAAAVRSSEWGSATCRRGDRCLPYNFPRRPVEHCGPVAACAVAEVPAQGPGAAVAVVSAPGPSAHCNRPRAHVPGTAPRQPAEPPSRRSRPAASSPRAGAAQWPFAECVLRRRRGGRGVCWKTSLSCP